MRGKPSFGVVALLCFFLFSCSSSDSPVSMMENYLYRLSNSLKTGSVPVESFIDLYSYPIRRQLLHDIPASRINLLEFLRLSSCDLQRHIGQRNSSLGSLMKSSQRLIYEYKFIVLAEECINYMNKSDELYPILQQVLSDKYKQLPLVKWNAIFGSEEFSTLFSLSSTPLPQSHLEKPEQLYSALDMLKTFLNSNTDGKASDGVEIEQSYAVVASSKRLGELRLSMSMLVSYLAVADAFLMQRTTEKPLCFTQKPNQQSAVVQTVFLKFYIGEVQPYIAKVNQQAKVLLGKIDSLMVNTTSVESFDLFWEQVYEGEESEWQRFNQAVKRHTKNWQSFLAHCGQLPG
jgi:hypothetical protein